LKAHFDLARKYSRSIVLHQVQASGALADFISGEKPETPVLIHGFSGSKEILKRYIQLDLFISLGPGVHSGGVELTETLKLIPDNRLLLETDWPYTAGRGSTSYKEILNQHYEEISRAMGVDVQTLAWRIRENGAVFTN
jgi:TatD DNase family protein